MAPPLDKRPPADDTVNDEYRAPDKEAPIVAATVPATGDTVTIGAAVAPTVKASVNGVDGGAVSFKRSSSPDNEVAETFVKVRKPRHKAVQAIVDGAKRLVSSDDKPVNGKPVERKLSPAEALARVKAEDARRMRPVEKYGDKGRMVLAPLVRTYLRETGVKNSSQEDIDSIVTELCKSESPVGYRVNDDGEIEVRELPIDKLFLYTWGSHAISAEDFMVRQWLDHPTVFDVLVTVGGIANAVFDMGAENSPIKAAIAKAVSAVHPKVTAQEDNVTHVDFGNAEAPEDRPS